MRKFRKNSTKDSRVMPHGCASNVEQLREEFRHLAESIPQLIWTATADGKLDYVNTRWIDYCGLDVPDLRGVAGLLHPEDEARCREIWLKARETGTRFECEYRMRRKDGVYRWHLALAMPKYDKDGKIQKWFGSNTDIHDHKLSQELLQKNESRFRGIFESNLVGMFFWELNGVITDANDAFLQTIGYTRDDLAAGLVDYVKLTPPDHNVLDSKVIGTGAVDSSKTYDKEYLRKDGSRVAVTVGISTLVGSPRNGIAFVIDISEKKRIELEKARLQISEQAAQQTTRLKSEFLANISHEIRTPINGVMGMLNLLLDTPLNSEQRDFAETSRHSAEMLLTLINDILDFSKIEAGKLDFEISDFSIEEFLADIEKTMGLVARQKNIELVKTVSKALPRVLKGDSMRLKQVVINLVNNAIKFTEAGAVSIHVEVEADRSENCVLRFEIADTGIGLSEDHMKVLFQPFSQADSSMARRFGGTGLGLSICKSLVSLMDGEIGVRSQKNVGSTFWFTAKLEQGDHVEFCSLAKTSLSHIAKMPLRILLAEDNLVNQKIAVRLLEKWGCKVEVAVNGKEALERASFEKHDLILMDCQMPEMDGYEATRLIRALPNATSRIPIVAMTANAMSGDREKCFAAGMSGFVTKPVRNHELIDAIEKALSQDEVSDLTA